MAPLPLIDQLNLAVNNRNRYFSSLQRCYDLIKDGRKEPEFLQRAKLIDDCRNKFESYIDQIMTLNQQVEAAQVVNTDANLEAFEKLFFKIKAHEGKIVSEENKYANTKIQLPKLELPEFAGDINQFPVFYYTFKSLIHDNPQLSNEQRVQYLASKLSHKALSVVDGIPTIGQNYSIIWNKLVDKYLDKRVLTSTYLDQLLELKSCKGDSFTQLSNFVDKFSSSVACLNALKLPNKGDVLVCHIGLSKLDSELRKQFEMSVEADSYPTVELLLDFLKKQVQILCRIQSTDNKDNNRGSHVKQKASSSHDKLHPVTRSFVTSQTASCIMCHKNDKHPLYRCEKFLNASVSLRYDVVKKNRLCFSCLNSAHRIENCPSKYKCHKCQGAHNTLLHYDSVKNTTINTSVSSEPVSLPSTSAQEINPKTTSLGLSGPVTMCTTTRTSVLLSTVKVETADMKGEVHELRLLLDSGSESNLLDEKIVKKLGLNISKIPSSVQGIGGQCSPIKGKVDFKFNSKLNKNLSFAVKALVVSKITDNLPSQPMSLENLSHLKNIVLSDDEFNESKPVHGILGSEMFAILIEPGKVIGPGGGPVAVNTLLGYTVMGGRSSSTDTQFCGLVNNFEENTLEKNLIKFMEIEDVPNPSSYNNEDIECEEIFKSTVSRCASGKFQVSLPFRESPDVLGESFLIAKKRFINLEKKLQRAEGLHSEYCLVMKDFLDHGYMSLIPNDLPHEGYYIPQQVVVRKDHTSFKLRPVFDASCITSTGKSLNDILHTGPKLYNDLFIILLSFRLFYVVLTADIKKMYLQILVAEQQRKYQKILFRSSPEDELETYSLNTVTFGLTCSPYLALRCVRELAEQEVENFPLASKVLLRDSYMDDIICSIPSESEALKLQAQLVSMLQKGGFQLSKWASNSNRALSSINDADKLGSCLKWDDSSMKVLGLSWHPVKDAFLFEVNVNNYSCTKRNVLKLTASIFDVLGLLAPVTLYAKLLIKYLWQEKVDWDENPPLHIQECWANFLKELPLLSSSLFPRHINIHLKGESIILIGFGDASEKAYACAIYARVTSPEGEVSVNLICAKSKVSPLKSLSIPRLELCAALLLSKLMKVVLDTYIPRVKIDEYFCLSDSTVTIAWVRSPPYKWKQFVANRTAKIQENVKSSSFYHIPGSENVSDCITRGMTPSQFIGYPVWSTGPPWLKCPVNEWPLSQDTSSISDGTDMEEKKATFVAVNAEPSVLVQLALRFSSWPKLLHSIVYVLRFLRLLPNREHKRILASDIEEAEMRLLRAVQEECFLQEIQRVKNSDLCSPQFQKLNPFLHNGLLLVGGRLAHAAVGFEQKHPILLPGKHCVTNLIVDNFHTKNMHTGPHLLLSLLRQRYWFIGARNIVRQRVNNCNHCFKFKPRPLQAMMGELPSHRVNETVKPFVHTGTDYTGSVLITLGKRRGAKSQKAYICLFVCLCTKAIHLELAADLSTEAFLSAFKRFLARRGSVSTMYSDGATNYLGAKNKLDEVFELIESRNFKQVLSDELTRRRIEWSFIPPASPHMGGLWEANIKQVKQHLLKVIGSQILTYEEMYTVLTQVEALLNSRPLCPLSSDPNDVQVLTPAHFLHSTPLDYIPAPYLEENNVNRLSRYQLLDHLVQTYWRRWSQEYLHNLQVRAKWTSPNNPPVKVGQVVIVKEDNSPPLTWTIGLITDIYPGEDGIVRVVQVRTKSRSYKRPVVKVCPLPTQ